MIHPVIEDLQWRKTTKKYNPDKKVSEDDLNVFLEALRLSASSINSQPWKFLVIDSQKARQRMYNTFARMYKNNQPHVFESAQFILFAHNPEYSRGDFDKVIDKYIEDGRIKPEDREKVSGVFSFAEKNTDETGNTSCWTRAQVYLALGNALHTLARMRIDSTPIEGIDVELVNKEFSKELDGYQCDVALAIGYHHEDDYNAMLPKSRLAAEDVILRF